MKFQSTPPQRTVEQKESLESLTEVSSSGLENLRIIKTQYGNVSLASDIGVGYHKNEDRVFIDTSKNLFGVADGMGGYPRGDDAAQIISEEVLLGIKANINPAVIQGSASIRMRKEGIFQGGACYVYFQVDKKSALVRWAGDALLLVVDEKGNIVYETKGLSLEKAPRGNSTGEVTSDVIDLMNYSTIIAASDGLWDNINKEDLQQIVTDTPTGQTDQIAKKLFEIGKHGMEYGFMTDYGGLTPDKRKNYGKMDNISIVVFQKLPK